MKTPRHYRKIVNQNVRKYLEQSIYMDHQLLFQHQFWRDKCYASIKDSLSRTKSK